MFNWIKNLFGDNGAYERKFKAAVDIFSESTNPYDVRVANIMAMAHQNKVDNKMLDEIMATPNLDRTKFRESILRFEALIK